MATSYRGTVKHAERALDHHEVHEVQGQDAHAAVRVLHGLEPVTAQQPGVVAGAKRQYTQAAGRTR
jgi:hypothetical protein